MKILFFIYASEGNASGGHYNSLHQVSLEMAKNNDVEVIMLGKVMSPILTENPFVRQHITINSNLSGIKKLNDRLKLLFKKSKPDVLHCFDTESLNLIILTPSTKNIPIVYNKCGGPSPLRKNHQHADAIVVFSSENQQWYYNNKYYGNESIFLIPNRVMPLNLIPEHTRIEKADPKKITFVRISRLGGAYEMTLLQTYNLLEKLNSSFEVELYVVGRVQDENRFELLKNKGLKKNYKIHFITDKRASKGSEFLYLADFVVGTGRSFMEATSLGIPTLTPVKNADIPILVNSSNVEHFLSTNFSERNVARDGDSAKTIQSITNLVSDNSLYKKYQVDTKKYFEKYFGTSKINKKYTKVYEYVLSKGTNRTRLVKKNFLYLGRTFLK